MLTMHLSIFSPRGVGSGDTAGIRQQINPIPRELEHLIRGWEIRYLGAQWPSGRVSDSGVRGWGFDTYLCHVVSLSKDTFTPRKVLVIPRKWWLCPDMTEKLLTGMLNQHKQELDTSSGSSKLNYITNLMVHPRDFGHNIFAFGWVIRPQFFKIV